MNFIKAKKTALLAVLLFACIPFVSFGQTQAAMNLNADKQHKKADKELNAVYQKILKEYAAKPQFIKKFKAAQRLWVQLRNAELEAKFPEPADYGTVEPMCKAIYLASLTKERTNFLRVWLTGIEEGDVCSGSVKMK